MTNGVQVARRLNVYKSPLETLHDHLDARVKAITTRAERIANRGVVDKSNFDGQIAKWTTWRDAVQRAIEQGMGNG